MAKEILKMKNITKRFGGVTALKNVDMSINEGEIVCLLGENGSGKSTMIKIVSGVYTLDEGQAFIGGEEFKRSHHCSPSMKVSRSFTRTFHSFLT